MDVPAVELKSEDVADEMTAYSSNNQQDCQTGDMKTENDKYCNFSQKLAFEIKKEEEDNSQETDNVPKFDNTNQEIKQEEDNTMNGAETVKLDSNNVCQIISHDHGHYFNQDTNSTAEGIDTVRTTSIFHLSQSELRGGNSLNERENDETEPHTVIARPQLSTSSTSTLNLDDSLELSKMKANKRHSTLEPDPKSRLSRMKENKYIGKCSLDAPEIFNKRRPERGLSPTQNDEIPKIDFTPNRVKSEEDSDSTEEWETNLDQNPGSDIEEDLDEIPNIDFTPNRVKSEEDSDSTEEWETNLDQNPGSDIEEDLDEIPNIDFTPNRIQSEEDSDSTEEWETNLDQNPGSDIEEDLDLSSMSSYRQISSHSVDEETIPSNILKRLLEADSADDLILTKIVDSAMLNFNWTDCIEEFKGEQETFTGPSGATMPVDDLSSPLAIFEMIWEDDIMDLIVQETNRYAHQLMSLSNSSKSRMKQWQGVCKRDIWLFLAVTMLQSFVHLKIEKEYWYPPLPHLAPDIFKETMSFAKFILLKKILHFVDNQNIPENANKKLAKIKPIIDHLNTKFSSLYQPEQIVVIDESLIPWKGKILAQQISNKVAKVDMEDIRSYELCESKSGYLWRMIFHPDKHDGSSKQQEFPEDAERLDELEGTSQIVYNLVRPLLNKGHTLVMDSFYNSPLLSRFLKSQKTDTMGTMRLSRDFVPNSLKSKTKTNMQQGEVAYSQTEDLSVVVWKDSNIVSIISTYHKIDEQRKCKSHSKPKVVLDYNNSMESVDKKEQSLSAYSMEKTRNASWYKRLFRRLLNVSIHNAWVLHSQKQITNYRQFRMTLIKEILLKYKGTLPRQALSQIVVNNLAGEGCRPNLVGAHYPEKNESGRKRCKLCSRNKMTTRTVWRCDTCKIDLCIVGCFKQYHT